MSPKARLRNKIRGRNEVRTGRIIKLRSVQEILDEEEVEKM